ncbi:GNAT family N-acetyltransferase [Lentilactobacillus diolivorans]|uniref:Acetyltransferase, GNAT family n=2 Tax=Lentilactobacillus diolivorans TaxID=179838 RepID=A0A0R1SFK0_9LACO|nr:GNAT family protein [Lentilactobacillus diolivorans]KRL68001.1 acetyltransferase, GNAT family [Lentilactobacillus diolivorans DSM 14421]GEP24823.1 ribosomal protein acetylating enzyme [Lentilactobacillus diolivorans]
MFINQINEKIALKLPTQSDAEPLLELIDEDRQYLGKWLPWVKLLVATSDERDFLQDGAEKMAQGNFWFAVILVDGEVAGMLDLHGFNQTHHRCQIGYWLGSRFQGRGVMTICVAALEKIAFEELNMNRLELMADKHNQKSRSVAERRDFYLDGILNQYAFYNGAYRDMALYSKLRQK